MSVDEKKNKKEQQQQMANGKQVQYHGRCMDQKGESRRRGKKSEVFSRVETAEDYILKQMRAFVRGAVERLSGGDFVDQFVMGSVNRIVRKELWLTEVFRASLV